MNGLTTLVAVASLITLATAAPHRFGQISDSYTNVWDLNARSAVSGSSSCAEDGKFMCNGPGQFGVCSNEIVIWAPTADGTICSCDQGECNIVAGDDGSTSVQPDPTLPFSSAHTPSSVAPAPSPSVAPAPTPSAAPAPSSSEAPAPSSTAAPAPSSPAGSGSTGQYTYKTYLGDGSPSDGWPTLSDWLSFDELWTRNVESMSTSCESFDQQDNSPQEIAGIKSALLEVSDATGVDARFALATMMQESLGCVRCPTTTYSITNPGLFQSHEGTSCFGEVPCPDSKITQMVHDGLGGTSSGDGYQQCLQQTGGSDAQSYYEAARIYNSGSIAPSGNLEDGIATKCYASDVANRLTGWSQGTSSCTLDG